MVSPLSVAPLQPGARKIRHEDLLEALARPGPADRAPLTESDAVSRSHSIDGEVSDRSSISRRGQGESSAPEQLAGRGTQDLPNGGSVDSDHGAVQPDGEL